jgi:hypothetical protein
MAVMDEFREEREALKHGTFRQKFSYFWLYYKWHVIGGLAAVVFLGTFAHGVMTGKDDAFYGAFPNAWELEERSGEFLQGFAAFRGIDTGEYNVSIDSSLHIVADSMDETSIAATQKLMVYIAAGELDVLASDAAIFRQYAYNDVFADLRTLLTLEQMEQLGPYFYYVDRAVVEQLNEAVVLEEADLPAYPDPSKPEDMAEPVPVGVFVDSCRKLQEAYVFAEGGAIGILVNTKRPGEAVGFLEYLFE